MNEEQKILSDCIKADFSKVWDRLCTLIPEVRELLKKKDIDKVGKRYEAKFESLCHSGQEVITAPCLFDDFIASLQETEVSKDFQELLYCVSVIVQRALQYAELNSNSQVLPKIKKIIKDMIVTSDVDAKSTNADYHNRLNELLVFNMLSECENIVVADIAYPLGNNKDCDFRCVHSDGSEILIEVVSIHNINLSKQDDANSFSVFIGKKIQEKYSNHTKDIEIGNLKILPIIEYREGLDIYTPSVDLTIATPAYTVIKNISDNNIECLLVPIDKLKLNDNENI